MIITEIYIKNFGKFENYKINFNKGFNLIYGDNESGKTTILTFILMVLYGSKSKSNDILINERKKYKPWNGKSMGGYINIEYENYRYQINREFKSSNHTDEVEIFNLDTGRKLDIPNLKNPGEYFFELGYEAFKKSLFISSESLVIENDDKKDEITQKLINIITTGEEDISYKKTIDNLNREIETYKSKSGHKGKLVDIDNKLENIIMDLNEAKNDERDRKNYFEKVKKLENNIKAKEIQIEKIKKIIDLKAEKNKIENQKNNIFISRKKDKLLNLNNEINLLEEKQQNIKKTNIILSFNFFDFSLIFSIVFILIGIFTKLPINYIVAFIFLILFIYNTWLKNKNKNTSLKNIKEEIYSLKNEYQKLINEEKQISEEIYYMDKAIEEINYNINKTGSDFKDVDYTNLEKENLIKFNLEKEITNIITMMEERYKGKKNLSTLEKEYKIIIKEKNNLETQYRLLNKTKDLIIASFLDLENDFSKLLNAEASELISKITNSKYDQILVSNDFDILIKEKKSNEIKEWKFLSSGTIDQIYLALRLSLIKTIVKKPEKRILFLDDIFIRFDKNRMGKVLDILNENTTNFSQILLFVSKKYHLENYKNISKIYL